MMDHLVWFLVLTFIAEIIGTIGGFGSSVFFVPLAGFFFGFEEVLGVTAVFHVASNLAKIVLFKKGLDKFVLLNIGIPAVIFVLFGSYLSGILVTQYFELFLGAFLVLFSGFLLIKENIVIEPNARNAWIGGAFSGFAAGLLGTGGAIRGLTMAAFNMEKAVFISTSAAIDMGVDISRTVVYASNGFITKNTLLLVPFLLVVSFAGSYAGKYLLKYIPQEKFKKISLGLILVIGIVTLVGLRF
jgi:uncharacterized protein